MTLSIGSGNDLNSKSKLCTFSDTLEVCTIGCWSIVKQQSENLCGLGFPDVGSKKHLKTGGFLEMVFAGFSWMYEGFVSMQFTGFVKKGDGDGESGVLVIEDPMFLWFQKV